MHNVMHKYALFMHNIGNSLCIMSIGKPNAKIWHLFAVILCIIIMHILDNYFKTKKVFFVLFKNKSLILIEIDVISFRAFS